MDYTTEVLLKKQADKYFDEIPKEKRNEIEAMYAAFKARFMVELRVSGGSNQGVVYGHLTKK